MLTTTIDLVEDRRNQLLEEARRHRLAQMALGAGGRRRWGRSRNGGPGAARRRRSPLAMALVGLALAGLSAGALVLSLKTSDIAEVTDALPAVVSRPADVATADLVYEPGQSSGWHTHPGVHSVVVVSGTLTVYDEACRPQDYGPGQAYLGGREPHLARNTGPKAVALVVTYVADPSAHSAGSPVGTPSGCETA